MELRSLLQPTGSSSSVLNARCQRGSQTRRVGRYGGRMAGWGKWMVRDLIVWSHGAAVDCVMN